MPNATVKKVSEICNKPIDEVEKLFTQAEELAKEQGKEKNYSYIMGIFKKSLGKECLDKLKWNIEESMILNTISDLIVELNLQKISNKISPENKFKLCEEIYRDSRVQSNIKRFKLENSVDALCKSLKIMEIKEDKETKTLFITIFPINEKNPSYLGDHVCDIECDSDFTNISVSLNG